MTVPPQTLDQGLRNLLRPEAAPAALRQQLLNHARRADARGIRHPWHLWTLAAAACLCLALGSLMGRALFDPGARLARQAYADFLSDAPLNASTGQMACAKGCCPALKGPSLGFVAPLPGCVECTCVTGGRSCRVADREAAFYRLEDGKGIFVFRDPLPRATGQPGRLVRVAEGHRARVWNEAGHGYILVEPR